jgi:hypothetical protein
VCRNYACEEPQDTPEGFFHQLTGHEIPPGLTSPSITNGQVTSPPGG